MSSDLLIPASTTSYSSSSTSMASQQPPATMEKLPNDVLSNIFIRLLAKQLAQMRSVSKSMNALLSQPSFIKSHLRHSIQNNDEILLFFYVFDDLAEPFSAHPSKSPNLKLTNFIKPPVDFISVVGSVNGLICYSYESYNDPCVLQIWNPSLSAVLTLPPHAWPSPVNYPMIINFNLRFGFDPKADDYKVVKLASVRGPPSSFEVPTRASLLDTELFVVKEWLQLEVYSMRKRNWKRITQSFPSHITWVSRQDDVCVDGLLHWIGSIGEEKKWQTIVAFDLGAETFNEIPLPDSILPYNASNSTNVLGVLDGKLCVMSYVYVGECEVWVMDEYGVVESWFKHHAFSQFRNIAPFGFTLHNEFLFQVGDDDDDDDGVFRLGLYDPVAAKTKFFKVCQGFTKIFVGYVDSLVWVAPDEREMVKYLGLDLHHGWFPLLSIGSIALAIAFSVARLRK